MIIFTLRRLLLLLITLFFLTFVGFSLSYFTPHAPLQGASLWNAWLFWFEGVLHWDFGVSSINGQLISEQLREVFPATMELCILAFGFALLIGIPVGMIAGVMRNKWPDTLISAIALVGFSIPVFWLPLQALAGPCRAGAQVKGGKRRKPAEPGVDLRLIQGGQRQV